MFYCCLLVLTLELGVPTLRRLNVFVDILGVLVAALSRLFGLATNRTLEPSVPTLRNTHCECVLFLAVFFGAVCLHLACGYGKEIHNESVYLRREKDNVVVVLLLYLF